MSFLRQFRDTKQDTKEYLAKQVVENVIGTLAMQADGERKLWYRGNPCPLKLLPELYEKYVHRSHLGAKPNLIEAISGLGNPDLEEWLSSFDFFKIIDIEGNRGLVYSPCATDIMVECFYQQHRFSGCFQDVLPALYWNRCPVCGRTNNNVHLKYSILCSATDALLCKWCSFFHKKEIIVPNREAEDYVCRHCAHCSYIDCPFAWDFAKNDGKGKNRVGMVSFLLPEDAMQRYAHFISMPSILSDLASVAEEEFWGSEFWFLRMYLYLTFYFQTTRRSQNEGLIETTHYSWFNTGLQTRDTCEDIFMCFKPGLSGWTYDGLTWNGAPNGLYDKFRGSKGMIPEYVPPYRDVSELFWDVKLDLNWRDNFEHIYFDNLKRILESKSFRNNLCGVCVPSEFQEDVDKSREIIFPKDQQYRDEQKRSKFYNDLLNLFEHSVKLSLKKLRHNYKWILPIYFPRNRSMSLALPLFLNREGQVKEPDLALVCTRRKDNGIEYYDARTVFAAYMIYGNARQVCKPFAEWVSGLLDDDYIGKVIFLSQKFFGFIRSDSGRKLWFSVYDNSSVTGLLKVGDRVKFDFTRNEKGWVAVNVRLQQSRDDSHTEHKRNVSKHVECAARQSCRLIGRVEKIGPSCGYIRSEDGRKIFFPRALNRDVFDLLKKGVRVIFDCGENDKGYIASKINIDDENSDLKSSSDCLSASDVIG